jgi:aminoglycoside/choline kinase family phosphotransferase
VRSVCHNPAMHDDLERARAAATEVVARVWVGARVADCVPVPGDASSRRYVRCSLQPGSARNVPATIIIMLNEGSGAALSSDELGVFGSGGPKELPFVNTQRYLARLCDAVPILYGFTTAYAEVVLEDVGDLSLWAATEKGNPEGLFGKALDLLAELQTLAIDDGSGCYAFRQAFDERLFNWEFDHYLEYGVQAAAPGAFVDACRAELRSVARRLAALPRVFTHRDYHAWNLHVQDGRIRILDFQDALLAPAMYDVASLLTDRTTPARIPLDVRHRLIARFASRIPEGTLGDLDAQTAFDLCALQRVLKVIGRFNYLYEMKGKPRYAELLPAVVPTARELCALRPNLEATARLLELHVKGNAPCAR